MGKAQRAHHVEEHSNLTTPIFIGVDGGATKTHVRVENQAGELLGQGTGGPANIRLSIDKSWESIYSALEQALKPKQIHLEDKKYQFHIGMGLAGCEVKEMVEQFTARPLDGRARRGQRGGMGPTGPAAPGARRPATAASSKCSAV